MCLRTAWVGDLLPPPAVFLSVPFKSVLCALYLLQNIQVIKKKSLAFHLYLAYDMYIFPSSVLII